MLTTMAGYAVAPAPFSLLTFATVTVGTGLTSAAANAINQVRDHGLSRQGLMTVVHFCQNRIKLIFLSY